MPEPTITSASATPKPPVTTAAPPPKVEGQIPYDQIVAKPLNSPNFLSMKHKNPNVSVRWVNCSVGDKESKLRFNQAQAQGFECCTPDEVVSFNETGKTVPCPPALTRDGRVIYGDLILMKMARNDYVGALKYKEERARMRVKRPGIVIEGDHKTHQEADGRIETSNAFADIARNPNLAKKIQPYIPPIAEIEAGTLASKTETAK